MERIEFTKEMRETHKILLPNMLDIHFSILERLFNHEGYNVEVLRTTDSSIVDVGLKYIHNDTCYPALLSCGQMIHALQSGDYDLDKTALIMSQTGGGCRASNYIHLLRKALYNADMAHIPVISFSFSGLEKNSGFKMSAMFLRHAIIAVVYGDLLMLLHNQTKPYEINEGASLALVNKWIETICHEFETKKIITKHQMDKNLKAIASDFNALPVNLVPKVKVGIVGEIYVKYAPLANNNLEDFLASQDCEVMVPGVMGFAMYNIEANLQDILMYGGSKARLSVIKLLYKYVIGFETSMRSSLDNTRFTKPASFAHLKKLVEPVIGLGCKMGEGWLLTAEMLELIESGYENIVCAQPFGCLPNHIVGKGMIRKIVTVHENANIVPIDYDPGAAKVNQENRIKLMLAVAKERLEEKELATV